MTDVRAPTDGQPFYCEVCGAGWGEFIACEMPDCSLETVEEAETRLPPLPSPAGPLALSEKNDAQ